MLRLTRALLLVSVLAFVLATPASAAPNIALEPELSFSFGGVEAGTAVGLEIAVGNFGTSAGTIGSSTMTGSPAFGIDLDDCEGLTLAPNEYCIVYVYFAPPGIESFGAQLTVPSDSPGGPSVLALHGYGTFPLLRVEPESLDYGTVPSKGVLGPVNTFNVLRANSVDSISMRVEGPDASSFELGPACPHPTDLSFGCGGTLGFRPQREGPHAATLIVEGGGSTVTVPITGAGGPPRPTRPTRPPRSPGPRPNVPTKPITPIEEGPTRAEVRRALAAALVGPTARWRDLGRKRVRKSKVIGLRLPAMPQEGSFHLAVRTADKRNRLVAAGGVATGAKRLWASLTRPGKVLLAIKGKRKLRAILTFTADDGREVKAVRSFTLPG